ncbi:futalosine hydrolase [Desulfobacula phenolica]|uniref:Futalosine hydrolase n=1 Tax=Desulfobacula phenolica TaxID=90732 RepID=A0A1H2DVF9_9BACT|nr:futalosine hydrolase [Desulfobacula phenolica]SDT86822.1 futalosine hydrolase [Desulfobacula phenolica]
MNPDLLILCATQVEMSHFLTLWPGESKQVTRTGLTILSGKVHEKTYDLVLTGAGVFNAAHALTAYLEHASPVLILQTGIAGVFQQTGLNIGDVAIATQEHYIHTGVQTDAFKNAPLPFDVLKDEPLSRQGIYPFDPDMVDQTHDRLCRVFSITGTRIVKGLFITVSTITSSLNRANQLYCTFSSVMEAMEGAACNHIAALYGIPIIEVRAASNFVGERDKEKWDIDLAAKQLGVVCTCVSHLI